MQAGRRSFINLHFGAQLTIDLNIEYGSREPKFFQSSGKSNDHSRLDILRVPVFSATFSCALISLTHSSLLFIFYHPVLFPASPIFGNNCLSGSQAVPSGLASIYNF